MPFSVQQSSVLQLLDNHIKQMDGQDQALDRKAQQNISVSTIIVAFVTAFNLTQGTPSPERQLFLALVFLTYTAIFVLSYVVLSPKDYWFPLEPTWNEIQRVIEKNEQEYHEWLVSTYVGAIEHNTEILEGKINQIQQANLLIGADILFIFLAIASR